MSEAFEAKSARTVRRNRVWLALSALPLVALTAFAVGLLAMGDHGALYVLPQFAIVGLAWLSYCWRRNPSPVVEDVSVRATRLGARVGRRFIPRAALRAGYLMPQSGSTYMCRLERRFRPDVDVLVEGRDEARALLRALGLDASQVAAHFRVASRLVADRGVVLAAVAIVAALFGATATMFHTAALAAPIGLLFLLVAIAPTRVDVGTDGILVSWLLQRRFVRWTDIRLASLFDEGRGRSRMGGVLLSLNSGEELKLPVGDPRFRGERTALLLERIREAMASGESDGAPVEPSVLARGDRAPSAWLTHLRALGSGALAGPRTAPVDGERLWATVEDPRGDPLARAAAAVALAPGLDERGRERLRVLGDASAEPKLRVALGHVVDGADDDALETALAELEQDAASNERAAR